MLKILQQYIWLFVMQQTTQTLKDYALYENDSDDNVEITWIV